MVKKINKNVTVAVIWQTPIHVNGIERQPFEIFTVENVESPEIATLIYHKYLIVSPQV